MFAKFGALFAILLAFPIIGWLPLHPRVVQALQVVRPRAIMTTAILHESCGMRVEDSLPLDTVLPNLFFSFLSCIDFEEAATVFD